jgi:hypothetical protein
MSKTQRLPITERRNTRPKWAHWSRFDILEILTDTAPLPWGLQSHYIRRINNNTDRRSPRLTTAHLSLWRKRWGRDGKLLQKYLAQLTKE